MRTSPYAILLPILMPSPPKVDPAHTHTLNWGPKLSGSATALWNATLYIALPPAAMQASSLNGCCPVAASSSIRPSDQTSFLGVTTERSFWLRNIASSTSGAVYIGVPQAARLASDGTAAAAAAADRHAPHSCATAGVAALLLLPWPLLLLLVTATLWWPWWLLRWVWCWREGDGQDEQGPCAALLLSLLQHTLASLPSLQASMPSMLHRQLLPLLLTASLLLLLLHTSPGVSVHACTQQGGSGTTVAARPKSASSNWPSWTNMFSGLTSRCTTPYRQTVGQCRGVEHVAKVVSGSQGC